MVLASTECCACADMIIPRSKIVSAGTGFIGVGEVIGALHVGFSGVAAGSSGWKCVSVGCETVRVMLSNFRTRLESINMPS